MFYKNFYNNNERMGALLPFVGGLIVGGVFAPPKGVPNYGQIGAPSYAPPPMNYSNPYPNQPIYYDPTLVYYNNYGYVPNVPQQQVQTQSEYTFPGPYSS